MLAPRVVSRDVSNYSITEVTVKCCFPFIVINVDGGDNPQSCVYVTRSGEELPELRQQRVPPCSSQSSGWEKAPGAHAGTWWKDAAGRGGWRPVFASGRRSCVPTRLWVRRHWSSLNLRVIFHEMRR